MKFPKTIQLKHVGYALLVVVILINVYVWNSGWSGKWLDAQGLQLQQTPYYEDFDMEAPWTWSDSLKLTFVNSNLRYHDDYFTNQLYYLKLFLTSMLDAIAVALSLALIVHPANANKR